MLCPKCNRVVRPGNTYGRNETATERRYYCSCGFVTKTAEVPVVTWRKTEYAPRVTPPQPEPPAPVPVEAPPPVIVPAKPRKRRARKA